jgi:hypothetical protein
MNAIEEQKLESFRKLVKGSVNSIVVSKFGQDLSFLIPSEEKRSELYMEVALYMKDKKLFSNKVESFVYQNMSIEMERAYFMAKKWAASIFKEQNFSFTPVQLMMAFRGKEYLLFSEHTESSFIIQVLYEYGFDVGDKNISDEENDNSISDNSEFSK